jgi:hypothetical protein
LRAFLYLVLSLPASQEGKSALKAAPSLRLKFPFLTKRWRPVR